MSRHGSEPWRYDFEFCMFRISNCFCAVAPFSFHYIMIGISRFWSVSIGLIHESSASMQMLASEKDQGY